jgi:metal-dependent hydrolase (beta-lactamase superfamily II)
MPGDYQSGQNMKIGLFCLTPAVILIKPYHCTGDQAVKIFRELWGENIVDFGNGESILI